MTPVELRHAVLIRAHALTRGSRSLPDVPADLVEWVDAVTTAAETTTDAQVMALKAGGRSEDDILEVTEAAALGASLARLEIALEVIGSAG